MLLALSGCGATAGDAPPVPATAEAPSSETITGSGPTASFPGVDFPIPSGTRSVEVDFECAGGHRFSVELGDSMALGQAPLVGVCEGTRELGWPVTARTGQTLMVTIPEGVDWMATPRFSTEEWVFDDHLTAECETFSAVYSKFINADQGYTHYGAFGEEEWATRVDQASLKLEALAAASDTALASPLAQLHASIGSEGHAAGAVLAGTEPLLEQVSEICAANHTPVFVMAEFGG